MSVSIAIILDTRRIKKSGKYPVKLRVIVDRKPRLFPTIYELTEADYKKLEAPRVSDALQKIRNDLKQIDAVARTLAAKIIPFSLKDFEEEYITAIQNGFPFFEVAGGISARDTNPLTQRVWDI